MDAYFALLKSWTESYEQIDYNNSSIVQTKYIPVWNQTINELTNCLNALRDSMLEFTLDASDYDNYDMMFIVEMKCRWQSILNEISFMLTEEENLKRNTWQRITIELAGMFSDWDGVNTL